MQDLYSDFIQEQLKSGKSLDEINAAFAAAEEKARQLSLTECRKNDICNSICDLIKEYLILSGVSIENKTEIKDLINTMCQILDSSIKTTSFSEESKERIPWHKLFL